ncbi:OLC1v1005033C1 [Oldenlandia corymbosa var. corymbosa]|uniref:OLC1v1005033C1 n=1 Tax=Oldenlandia corymbosa var. corymbosa TaxID=529605 RepID=A0AAV1DDP6_OLDCO|nr:OLC1v1005033C1 [Oldenlandia corymbosa var. corymbosa]
MEEVSLSSRVPIYLVTVLDVSYNMEGTKIALLKKATGFLIPNLGPNGRLSVVAFSHNFWLLLPLCRMSESERLEALEAINRVEQTEGLALLKDGETDIAQWFRNGAKVMEDRRYKNPVSSIILLSDGQDNNVSMK